MHQLPRLIIYLVIGYFALALIVPDITFAGAFSSLFSPIYVDAPLWIFNKAHSIFEFVQSTDKSIYNGFQKFMFLMLMFVGIILSFALPILWVIFVTLLIWGIIYCVFPRLAMFLVTIGGLGGIGEGMPTMSDLILHKVTVEKSFDAHIQAKAIKAEFDKDNRKY